MSIKIQKLLYKFIIQPRSVKTFIAISLDFACIFLSVWIAYYLRLGDLVTLSTRGLNALAISIIFSFPIFFYFRTLQNYFQIFGIQFFIKSFKSHSFIWFFYVVLISFIGVDGIPRTIGLIQPLLFFLLICIWRVFVRFILRKLNNKHYAKDNIIKALVYGSGKTGRQLVRAMQENSDIEIKGFIDDDINQQGCQIDGKLIYSANKIRQLITQYDISLILLALPSVHRKRRNMIIENLTKYKIAVRTVPDITDIAKGLSSITEVLELDANDLLERVVVEPSQSLIRKNILSKTIMITGQEVQ